MNLVAEAVGKILAPLTFNLAVKVAVSVGADRPQPDPASLIFLEFCRKTCAPAFRIGRSVWHKPNDTTTYTQFIGEQLLAAIREEIPA